ncbi:hypothetical protein J9N36_004446 [Salmonella enterica]|nr:hypothetical protein [Salmonella enterica subsp. enterica serovar Newport]EHI3123005.1 hypothetical protein [Salmonella enterica]
MSHQTIVATLDSGDNAAPKLDWLQTLLTEISFLKDNGKLEFGLDKAIEGLGEYGLTPTDMSVDLALLAATVTAADTRIPVYPDALMPWIFGLARLSVIFRLLTLHCGEIKLNCSVNYLISDRGSLVFTLLRKARGGRWPDKSVN